MSAHPPVPQRVVDLVEALVRSAQVVGRVEGGPQRRQYVMERRQDIAQDDLICAIADAIEQARTEGANGIGLTQPVDPREPNPTREGFWALHNCALCADGRRGCVRGNPLDCPHPYARNG